MKISSDELKDILASCYNPYPEFTEKHEIDKFLKELKDKMPPVACMDDFAENAFNDIRDDIQNCGRHPMAKFIEHVEPLIVIKYSKPEEFDEIIDYFVRMINSH